MQTLRAQLLLSVGTNLLLQDSPSAAFKWILRAHVLGYPLASAVLGLIFEFGCGVPLDFAAAERLYLDASRNGVCLANARLAFLRIHGRPGISINHAEAAVYRQKVNVAGANSLFWLTNAASKGLAVAMLCVGLCHYNSIGLQESEQDAFNMFKRAAEKGLPPAMNMLGNLYIEGTGCEKNPELGLRWYIRAAEAKEPAAIFNIGTLYERGLAVEQNFNRAFEWYIRSAMYGSIVALNVIGIFHERGFGVVLDSKEAVKWYTKGAICGHPHSQYNLARCYHDGYGIERNDSTALDWFTKAGEQGHTLSLVSAAICYEFGIGSDKDMKKATVLYEKAYAGGNKYAKARLAPLVATRILSACNMLFPNARPSMARVDSKYFEDDILVKRTENLSVSNTINSHNAEVLTASKGLGQLPYELRLEILDRFNYGNILTTEQMRQIRHISGLHLSAKPLDKHQFLKVLGIKGPKKMMCECVLSEKEGHQCRRIDHYLEIYDDI